MNDIVKASHAAAVSNGWWDNQNWNLAEKIALIHSEVSEALEADRKNKYCKHSAQWLGNLMGEFDSGIYKGLFEHHVKDTFEDEMADAVIRIFDLCGKMNIPLKEHVQAKLRYNTTRGKKHGNKKY